MATATSTRNGTKGDVGGDPGPSNDAEFTISFEQPYTVELTIEGSADILFHRWSDEDVKSKTEAKKGSTAKKTDNVEAYVWRVDPTNDKSHIGIPGEYLRQSIIHAAKFRQDPRSPRKSAMDLFKAAVISLTDVAPIKTAANRTAATWDYIDSRRVTIQRAGVTRQRPAFKKGWKATFLLMVNLPEYVEPQTLLEVINQAGRVVGLADNRPSYGRFNVVAWKVLTQP